ncbi:MAG: hypothetical protein EBS61_02855 [Betaproteobacteria bacterium]|nr:hypothetical protein [Betaproteobacteria bacterium]
MAFQATRRAWASCALVNQCHLCAFSARLAGNETTRPEGSRQQAWALGIDAGIRCDECLL